MSVVSAVLERRRNEAAKRLRARELPNRRIEDWKYTDLRAALGAEPFDHTSLEQGGRIPQGIEKHHGAANAPAWVNAFFGNVAPPDFLSDASLAASEHTLVAFRVPEGSRPIEWLELDWLGHGQSRALLVLEDGASISVKDTVDADGTMNVGLEVVLGNGATLNHVRRSAHKDDAVAMATIAVKAAAGSEYRAHFADFGAKLSRTELHIALEGEGAQAHLSGVSVLGEGRHADVTTRITHAVGDTQSTQLFKIIAGGKSRGVYQGKVSVAEGANGSDSRQTAKGLLLGERAEIDLKPELEILADDVKCAHGAAVGDLDPESLFYLRSRGVSETEARALLMRAFLEDAVAEIADETIRAEVWSRVESALAELSA